jgi:alcohol dehydrogenase class IV
MSTASTPVRPFVGPGRVLSGPGATAETGAGLRAAGGRPAHGPVLLVADAAVLRLGLAERPVASLEKAGFDVDVRPPVTGEPTPDMVRSLIPEDPERPIAAVVALGGGSALDAAKLLALASVNDLDLTQGLPATADVEPGPTLVAIPTTAGTGAEATAVAMLWHGGAKRMFVHAHLVPEVAILDPELLVGLPPPVTAAGGLDAISHAVESLLSTFRTPLTESAARMALELLADSVRAAYVTGDIAARHDTLLGAFQAGLALNASVVVGHSMAYVVAARAGLPHGVTCAMALPYCLAHCRPAREDAIAEIAQIVCGEPDARQFMRWLVDANAAMAIPPSLQAVGVEASAISAMARECIASYPRPNHPVELDADSVERLFEHFLHGDALAAWDEASPAPVGGRIGGLV